MKVVETPRSGYHLLLTFNRREDLHAKIYIAHNILENYVIELYRRGSHRYTSPEK